MGTPQAVGLRERHATRWLAALGNSSVRSARSRKIQTRPGSTGRGRVERAWTCLHGAARTTASLAVWGSGVRVPSPPPRYEQWALFETIRGGSSLEGSNWVH